MKRLLREKIVSMVDAKFKEENDMDPCSPKHRDNEDLEDATNDHKIVVSVDLASMRDIRQRDYMKVFQLNLINA